MNELWEGAGDRRRRFKYMSLCLMNVCACVYYIYIYTHILEKEMATHSSALAWRISMDRGAWQGTVQGVARVRHDLATKPPPPYTYIWWH